MIAADRAAGWAAAAAVLPLMMLIHVSFRARVKKATATVAAVAAS